MEIEKYKGGGITHPDDPNIPKASVEVYIRSMDGETFYVGSLAEGLAHLLSKEGYRISITEYPHGAGWGPQNERFGVVIERNGDSLFVSIKAPGVFCAVPTPGRVVLQELPKTQSVNETEIRDGDVNGIPLTVVTLMPGKEIPWSAEPVYGETDLPVYSEKEIEDAILSLGQNRRYVIEHPSKLPEVLKALRKRRAKKKG